MCRIKFWIQTQIDFGLGLGPHPGPKPFFDSYTFPIIRCVLSLPLSVAFLAEISSPESVSRSSVSVKLLPLLLAVASAFLFLLDLRMESMEKSLEAEACGQPSCDDLISSLSFFMAVSATLLLLEPVSQSLIPVAFKLVSAEDNMANFGFEYLVLCMLCYL